MRVAVCALDREVRYALSRLAEETLLRRGTVPELALYPMLEELARDVMDNGALYDLVFIEGARDAQAVKTLCRIAPVILIGEKDDGPAAFDMGAKYFIEEPVYGERLDRAISRCLTDVKEKTV